MFSLKLADYVTLSRLLLTFVVVYILQTGSHFLYAFILTAIIIWMDGIDGYIARKLKQSNKFGASLDIICDRIVELIYLVEFANLHWINIWIPIIFITRGNLVDGFRAFAQAQGYTAFGENTMMKQKFYKFLVASNFSRFTYAITKAFAFCLVIASHCIDFNIFNLAKINYCAQISIYIATIFCIVRGIPVLIESTNYIKE